MSKYVKLSSLTSLANAIRAKITSQSPISWPSGFLNAIQNDMVAPTERGTVSQVLTASNKSFTIQRGVYTGGTVSVVGQTKTVSPSSTAFTVSADAGKVLTGVTVLASDTYQVSSGSWTANKDTSFSMSGLSFTPYGFMIVALGDSQNWNKIVSLTYDKNGTGNYGVASPNTSNPPGAKIQTATITLGSNSVSCSGIQGTYSYYSSVSGNVTRTFDEKFYGTYYYCIWGK